MARILPVNPRNIINKVNANSVSDFRVQKGKEQAWEQVLKVLNPATTGLYPQYQDDWAGFMREEMGARIPKILQNVIDSVMEYQVTVVPSGTQLGKSWLGAMLAVSFYKIYEQSQVYLIAAPPRSNLEINLMSKVKTAVARNKGMFANDKVTSLSISREPEQFIQGMIIPTQGTDEEKEARFSGKHSPFMLVLMDEGDAIPDFVYEAVDGWGSGGVLFRQVIFFNPKVKTGEVYSMIEEGRANVVHLCAFDHPNVLTGESIIPGAVTQHDTIRRIHEWTVPIKEEEMVSKEGCFTVPDFLCGIPVKNRAGETYKPLIEGWRKIKETNQEFSYKVLGTYPPNPDSVTIPEEWIQIARQLFEEYSMAEIASGRAVNPPTDKECHMGFDVSDEGSDHNCICLRYDTFPVFMRWKGFNANESAKKGVEVYKNNNIKHAFVDKGGVGAGVPGRMLEEGCTYVTGVFFSERPRNATGGDQLPIRFQQKRDELYWSIREWLRPENGAMLPDNRRLLRSLRALRHTEFNGKLRFISKDKIRKQIGFSPDELDALGLTFQTPKNFYGAV